LTSESSVRGVGGSEAWSTMLDVKILTLSLYESKHEEVVKVLPYFLKLLLLS